MLTARTALTRLSRSLRQSHNGELRLPPPILKLVIDVPAVRLNGNLNAVGREISISAQGICLRARKGLGGGDSLIPVTIRIALGGVSIVDLAAQSRSSSRPAALGFCAARRPTAAMMARAMQKPVRRRHMTTSAERESLSFG
jgi:hypothetical protein